MSIASDEPDRPEDQPEHRPGDGNGVFCDHSSCRHEPHKPGSLAERYPALVNEWDCTRPGPSPWTVLPGTSKKLHWTHLATDGHQHRWTATGHSRARLGSGCGVCHPRRGASSGINDLTTRRPDLAAQWCATHQSRRADQVTLGSKYKACWACPACGFHTRLAVHAKVAGNGCRRCAGQVALPGDPRTLAVMAPDRYAELDSTALPDGLDPLTLLAGSNRLVGWICRNCGAGYPATPNARRNGVGCPHCRSPHSSRIERDLRAALCERMPDFDPGSVALPIAWDSGSPSRPTRRTIRVDIHSAARRMVVEYDGVGFHAREHVRHLDTLKTRLLLDHGYTVIRIRENQLPDLDLNHPRLHHVRHQWGDNVDALEDRLVALIDQLGDPGTGGSPSGGPAE